MRILLKALQLLTSAAILFAIHAIHCYITMLICKSKTARKKEGIRL